MKTEYLLIALQMLQIRFNTFVELRKLNITGQGNEYEFAIIQLSNIIANDEEVMKYYDATIRNCIEYDKVFL